MTSSSRQHPQQPQRRRAGPTAAAPSTSPSRRCSRSTPGELEPVGRRRHRVQPLARRASRRGAGDQQAEPRRAPPRPTRPRSWCSWETPNRSASRTTMTVALGDVDAHLDRPSSRPARRPRRRRTPASSRPSPRAAAVRAAPRPQPASAGRPRSSSSTSTTARGGHVGAAGVVGSPRRARPASPSASRASSSPMRGHTTYAWRPLPTSSRTRCQARSSQRGLLRSGHDVVRDRRAPGRAARAASRSRGRRRRSSPPCAGSASPS